MGWWSLLEGGVVRGGESNPVWGDTVQDIMDKAVKKICREFQSEWGRGPSAEELQEGINMAVAGYDLPKRVKPGRKAKELF